MGIGKPNKDDKNETSKDVSGCPLRNRISLNPITPTKRPKKDWLLVQTFDGNTPWRAYAHNFQMACDYNGWDEGEKAYLSEKFPKRASTPVGVGRQHHEPQAVDLSSCGIGLKNGFGWTGRIIYIGLN